MMNYHKLCRVSAVVIASEMCWSGEAFHSIVQYLCPSVALRIAVFDTLPPRLFSFSFMYKPISISYATSVVVAVVLLSFCSISFWFDKYVLI